MGISTLDNYLIFLPKFCDGTLAENKENSNPNLLRPTSLPQKVLESFCTTIISCLEGKDRKLITESAEKISSIYMTAHQVLDRFEKKIDKHLVNHLNGNLLPAMLDSLLERDPFLVLDAFAKIDSQPSATELRVLEKALHIISAERYILRSLLYKKAFEWLKFSAMNLFQKKGGFLKTTSYNQNCVGFDWDRISEKSPEALALGARLEKLSFDTDALFETVREVESERDTLDEDAQQILELWKIFSLTATLGSFQEFYQTVIEDSSTVTISKQASRFPLRALSDNFLLDKSLDYISLLRKIAGNELPVEKVFPYLKKKFFSINTCANCYVSQLQKYEALYRKGYELYMKSLERDPVFRPLDPPKCTRSEKLFSPKEFEAIQISFLSIDELFSQAETFMEEWGSTLIEMGEERGCQEFFSRVSGGGTFCTAFRKFMHFEPLQKERQNGNSLSVPYEDVFETFLPKQPLSGSVTPPRSVTGGKKRVRTRNKRLPLPVEKAAKESAPLPVIVRPDIPPNILSSIASLLLSQQKFLVANRVKEMYRRARIGDLSETVRLHTYPLAITRIIMANAPRRSWASKQGQENHSFSCFGRFQSSILPAIDVRGYFADTVCSKKLEIYHHFFYPIASSIAIKRSVEKGTSFSKEDDGVIPIKRRPDFKEGDIKSGVTRIEQCSPYTIKVHTPEQGGIYTLSFEHKIRELPLKGAVLKKWRWGATIT